MKKIKSTKPCVKWTQSHFVVLLLACFVLNACSKDDSNDERSTQDSAFSLQYNLYIVDNDTLVYDANEIAKPFNEVEEKINSALEDYAVTMLVNNSKNSKKNTVLSPMSATLLYSMISNLSDNNTDYNCKKQLGISNFNDDDVNSYCRKLNYQTNQSEKSNVDGSKFSMSNNCWIQEKETVYKSFVSMTKSFGINVKGIDFNSQSGLNAIENSLNGMSYSNSNETDITSLGNVTSVVTTSMDLQKKWKNKFEKLSKDSIFTNADGSQTICEKIGGVFKVKYVKKNTFDMVEHPCSDNNFSLYVVYPHSPGLFDQSLKYVQDNGLEKCIGEMNETELSFHIPSFNLKGVTELNSSENSNESSDSQFYMAKLTKASSKGFNIGNTYQAYRIELNSKGISFEVQSSGTGRTSHYTGAGRDIAVPSNTPQIHIDHPFVIFIRNNSIKATVYACCIKDLSE